MKIKDGIKNFCKMAVVATPLVAPFLGGKNAQAGEFLDHVQKQYHVSREVMSNLKVFEALIKQIGNRPAKQEAILEAAAESKVALFRHLRMIDEKISRVCFSSIKDDRCDGFRNSKKELMDRVKKFYFGDIAENMTFDDLFFAMPTDSFFEGVNGLVNITKALQNQLRYYSRAYKANPENVSVIENYSASVRALGYLYKSNEFIGSGISSPNTINKTAQITLRTWSRLDSMVFFLGNPIADGATIDANDVYINLCVLFEDAYYTAQLKEAKELQATGVLEVINLIVMLRDGLYDMEDLVKNDERLFELAFSGFHSFSEETMNIFKSKLKKYLHEHGFELSDDYVVSPLINNITKKRSFVIHPKHVIKPKNNNYIEVQFGK